MANSIQHTFFFPHKPAMIWEYLTNTDLMELWLMKNDFQPIPGFEFEFRSSAIPHLDFDGIIYCKVLDLVPYKRLSYSWKGGPGDGRVTFDSVVNWSLQEKDNGTELSLDHNGFAEPVNLTMFNMMNEGWLKNIKKIADAITKSNHGTTNT
jgi:uncharacterized protein YndB with AHSA1/START domain